MRIPHTRLSAVVLRAVVQEFVTRDGTDHSSVEQRIEAVLGQLDAGLVELHFDAEAETCNIVPVEGKPTADLEKDLEKGISPIIDLGGCSR